MGTLIFVCPTTGHQVSTGVEVDRSSYKRLPRTKTAIFCPRCHKNHLLIVTATAHGTTQGIATRRADRRMQRYVTGNLSGWGVRAGPRNACQGWGVDGLRPSCKRAAVVSQ